jgi:anti-sigma regulatory factor (Ser/Thr protein kinase)
MSVQRRWSHETLLDAHATSASHARAFVTGHLVAHDLADMVDDLRLVVSELATNALHHAQSPFTVRLRAFEATLRLEVVDGSDVVPSAVAAGPLDTYGRGMVIVQAVSRDWGTLPRATGGKSVWAEFDIPRTYSPAL